MCGACLDANRAEQIARAAYHAPTCPLCHEPIAWHDDRADGTPVPTHTECEAQRIDECMFALDLEQVWGELAEAVQAYPKGNETKVGARRLLLAKAALRLLCAAVKAGTRDR